MPSETEPVRYSRTACLPCRKSKRRCDKKVPSCDLCSRKEVICRYPTRRDGTTTSPSAAYDPASETLDTHSPDTHSRNHEGDSALLPFRGSGAKAIYFIAPHIFQQARLELPHLDIPIPSDVVFQIGDASAIRNIATTFFKTVHRWLPIISKRGFFTCLLNPLARRQTELTLLTLCMKLCCTAPSYVDGDGGNKPSLYRIAKRFHQVLGTAGVLSIYMLQAEILIAFYELGQAIYPAAYLTVGACARYGLALGIDKLSLGLVGDGDVPRSWNEVEERRRVWWAVLIFDRFLSLNNPMRPLSTEDPTFDTYLPVDDAAWDDHQASSEDAVRISTGFELKMGSFARLAQATYLLGQALRSITAKAAEGRVSHDDRTAQLRRTLLALVHATDREATIRQLEYCAQSALSLSTILLLQEHHFKESEFDVDGEQTKPSIDTLWYETRTALERLSSAAKAYNEACPNTPGAGDHLPVFLIHAMYQVACILLRIAPGRLDRDISGNLEVLFELLRLINSRWRLAGVYLNILEAQEIITASETIETRQNVFPLGLGP